MQDKSTTTKTQDNFDYGLSIRIAVDCFTFLLPLKSLPTTGTPERRDLLAASSSFAFFSSAAMREEARESWLRADQDTANQKRVHIQSDG
jgi:hypothetical protein